MSSPKLTDAGATCVRCQTTLEDWQAEAPHHDPDGDVLCDDCYYDEYTFDCLRCGEEVPIEREMDIGTVLLLGDEWANGDLPSGAYRVLAHPAYMQPMIGATELFPHALQWLGPYLSTQGNGWRDSGCVCARCERDVLVENLHEAD